MAIVASNLYSGRVITGDTGYPLGKAQDIVNGEKGTGTPLRASWVNDQWGFMQALLDAANITPSGTPDQVGQSDYLDAVNKLIREPLALKIFQSPSSEGITEIQTRTVDANEVYEVRKTSDDSLATIYSDAAGTTEIVQDGTSNVSGSDGVVEFYIADGDYYVEVGGVKSSFITLLEIDFETVEDAKNYSGIESLIGSRIHLKDRQAYFDIVLTSAVTPNGFNIIQSTSNSDYSISLDLGQYLTAKAFGCSLGADNSGAIIAMVETGKSIDIDQNYEFTDIYIYPHTSFKGVGVLTGLNQSGVKPTKAQMDATDSNGRLSLLQTHRPNNVELRASVSNVFLPKAITNATFTPSGSSGAIELYGDSNLKNCAFHSVSLNSGTSSSALADNLVMSDVAGYGVFAFHGGSIDIPNSLIYKCERAVYLFQGGTINASDSEFYASTGIQVFANGGGVLRMPRSKVHDGAFGGVKCDYSSNIQMADSEVVNNGGVGVASESCSSVFAQGSLISGNGAWALTTSHNGYLQARGATISNNGNAATEDIAAITTLTGGFITLTEAIITDDNAVDANGAMIVAKANGYIMSEPAGGTGKEGLTAAHYNPTFGIMGNGSAIIYDTETVFNQYPDDGVGFSSSQKATNTRKAGAVSGTTLTVASSWVIVNDDSAVTIDNIVLQDGFYTDEIIIQPSGGGGGVTVQQGSGNIRLGAAKVLSGVNKITKLYKTEFSNLWLGLE